MRSPPRHTTAQPLHKTSKYLGEKNAPIPLSPTPLIVLEGHRSQGGAAARPTGRRGTRERTEEVDGEGERPTAPPARKTLCVHASKQRKRHMAFLRFECREQTPPILPPLAGKHIRIIPSQTLEPRSAIAGG